MLKHLRVHWPARPEAVVQDRPTAGQADSWWRSAGGTLLAAGLLAGLALWGAVSGSEHLAKRHVLADAGRSSMAWADHLARHVPDLDLVFEADPPSPGAQAALDGLRGTAGLTRFVLFNPAGQPLLHSESLGRPLAAAGQSPVVDRYALKVGQGGSVPPILRRGNGRGVALVEPAGQGPQGQGGAGSERVLSLAYVPVRHGQKIIGVALIEQDQTERAAVSASSFRDAGVLAGLPLGALMLLGTAVWRRRLRHSRAAEQRLHYLARHDTLTGALNRSSFHGALVRACEAQASEARGHQAQPGGSAADPAPDPGNPPAALHRPGFAVLTIDVDGFKAVNDLLGHVAGDRMLREVAERLRATLRGGDLLARLGGDQFAVLQAAVEHSDAAGSLAQRVVEALSQPFALAGPAIPGSASVGATLYGSDGRDADNLLHSADLALQRAKAAGRGRWTFFDAALDRALRNRRELTQALRDALAAGAAQPGSQQTGLHLHYQPLFHAGLGQLTGYEALARWPHPQRGFVPSAEFVPLAEEAGLIDELGRWVLNSACQEAAGWPAPLTVAVNLSAAQFRRGLAIVDEVAQALQRSGLAAQRLELEITESLLMQDTEQVLQALHALHALGVKVAMDDFGTGFSSLAYLWRFPFDKLKIDRAFVQGLLSGDDKVVLIVRSTVGLAHALGMRVNAEGVETEAQRQVLQQLGCDELQGYLLGRPQPVTQLLHRQGAAGFSATTTPALQPPPGPAPADPTADRFAQPSADMAAAA